MARAWNHRRCAGHVTVAEAGRVCVLAGQSETEVVAFAEAVAGLAVARGLRLLKPGPARAAPSAERLRHAGCSSHVDGAPWGFGRLCVARGSAPGEVVRFAAELVAQAQLLERAIGARVAAARELVEDLSASERAYRQRVGAAASWADRAVAPSTLRGVPLETQGSPDTLPADLLGPVPGPRSVRRRGPALSAVPA